LFRNIYRKLKREFFCKQESKKETPYKRGIDIVASVQI